MQYGHFVAIYRLFCRDYGAVNMESSVAYVCVQERHTGSHPQLSQAAYSDEHLQLAFWSSPLASLVLGVPRQVVRGKPREETATLVRREQHLLNIQFVMMRALWRPSSV